MPTFKLLLQKLDFSKIMARPHGQVKGGLR